MEVGVPSGVSDLGHDFMMENRCKPRKNRSEEEKSSSPLGFAAQYIGICHCKELKTSSQTHTKPLFGGKKKKKKEETVERHSSTAQKIRRWILFCSCILAGPVFKSMLVLTHRSWASTWLALGRASHEPCIIAGQPLHFHLQRFLLCPKPIKISVLKDGKIPSSVKILHVHVPPHGWSL